MIPRICGNMFACPPMGVGQTSELEVLRVKRNTDRDGRLYLQDARCSIRRDMIGFSTW